MAPSNVTFSVFSGLSFVLVLIPLPWHLQARNTGTCLYIAWTSLASLNYFINSIVWNGNAINWAPVWCDISARIIIGTSVAVSATSLCINRRLYGIATVQSTSVTRADKHRAVLVDLFIAIGIPILIMVLQYIVQGHRFDIFEEIGCFPFTHNTPPALLIMQTPPIILSIVSAAYGALSIRAFMQSRKEFQNILSANSTFTTGRYFRLMALAGMVLVFTLPLDVYTLYFNATSGLSPWISWKDTHLNFSRVDQFPAILWRSNAIQEGSLEASRWLVVALAIVFFAFFGFADEALRNYKLAAAFIAKRVGRGRSVGGGAQPVIEFIGTGSPGTVFRGTGFSKFDSPYIASAGKAKAMPGQDVVIYIHQVGSLDTFVSDLELGGFDSSFSSGEGDDVGSTMTDSSHPASCSHDTITGAHEEQHVMLTVGNLEKGVPWTPSTASIYSQASAPHSLLDRQRSLRVTDSFLELETPQTQESVLRKAQSSRV